ncbi:hypothetical protein TSAR_011623 [Trichomalopsis sarcophagae]|uniref:Uncharacterized protein n=1 Tax=Trichomalopsis sarcophagae TaxID=543379 RepID=A0A232EQB4_9HYME|nr:hypothetical protein TSAR_011623 [Trichomalopsis sarcophagae]
MEKKYFSKCRDERRAEEEGLLQELLEALATLLPGEPIAQVRQGSQSPETGTAASHGQRTPPAAESARDIEQSLLLHRPVNSRISFVQHNGQA